MPNRLVNKIIKTYLVLHSHIHQPSFIHQEKILFSLLEKCKDTVWGRKHGFGYIKSIKDFQNQVPITHYKDMEPWILYMMKGEKDIMCPGKIDWFATSSGTTGGPSKYIPITKANLKESHFKGGMEALSLFVKNNPRSQFFKGKGLAIGGTFSKNPYTGEENVGFISAILQKTAPWIGQYFREPNSDISFIENWEEKAERILDDTIDKNITFLSASPSWGSNFLYKALEYTGKKNILEIWPNFELYFWSGMAIDLYRSQFSQLLPSSEVKYYQVYNASEGFFATQDSNARDDMRLLTNHGVFYEFIPVEEYGKADPIVLTLNEVEINKNYVIVITNNSGLWRYVLGDTIIFTTLDPWRIKISGRTKYYIDIVGERVTADHTDKALLEACNKTNTIASDYTVAPMMYTEGHARGYHQWIIEFIKAPQDISAFTKILDQELCELNSCYYDERHDTKVLGDSVVIPVEQGTFYLWMKSKNTLGGQFKVPKLSNERTYADEILALVAANS